MLDSLIQIFVTYGYFAVFGVLLLSGFGLPIPEDITLVAGGFISSLSCSIDASFLPAIRQCHEVHIMVAVGMAGVLLGDSSMFLIGRIFGQKVLNFPVFSKIITQQRFEWAQQKFAKYGKIFVFAARFMPGLRSPIFIMTGISRKVPYLTFFMIDGLAALISVPLWVYVGFWGERQLSDMGTLEHYVKKGQLSILSMIGIMIIGTICFWFIRKKIKEKYTFFK